MHWVRSEDSTAALPLSPSYHRHQIPHLPSGLGPGNWQHVEELESQERNWGLFSLIVKTRSSNKEMSPSNT